jgi:ADP-heptose:LPS heptosyltransferase
MNKTGKNFKIWGIRSGLIGDTIMALPVLNHLEKLYPNTYKYFSIAKKCSQAAPIYFNHPLIDRIKITDFAEQEGETDTAIVKECDIVINTTPPVYESGHWFNVRGQVEECFLMAGFSKDEFDNLDEEEKKPYLNLWFDTNKKEKTIAIWPFAGYGKWLSRAPSEQWWREIIEDLIKQGWSIAHFGWHEEPKLSNHQNYHFLCDKSFFDQVKDCSGCELSICTDTGSAWIFGAYGLPQITLLTNHFVQDGMKHTQNPTAFAPCNFNDLNVNLFSEGSCSNITHDRVFEAIKSF